MKKVTLLVSALMLTASLTFTSCSESAQDKANATAEQVGDDMETAGDNAADNMEAAGDNVAG